MAEQRSRSKTESADPVIGNYYNYLTGTTVSTKTSQTWVDCDDVVGNPKGDNPFVLSRYAVRYPRYDKTTYLPGGGVRKSLTSWPGEYILSPPSHLISGHLLNSDAENQGLLVSLRAKTNPNRADVSLPTYIGELRDLPGLVRGFRDFGRWARDFIGGSVFLPTPDKSNPFYANLTKRQWKRYNDSVDRAQIRAISDTGSVLADAHLLMRWGVGPLISDLSKMFDFQRRVNNRIWELADLATGRPLKKRVALGSSASYASTGAQTHTSIGGTGFIVSWTNQTRTYQRTWGTIKWTLSDPNFFRDKRFDDPEKDIWNGKLASRLVAGLTSYEAFVTIWELIPWSWAIDWFTNFGDLIAACRNEIPVVPSHGCIMRETTTEKLFFPHSVPSGMNISSSPMSKHVTKIRRVVNPSNPLSPTFLPLLDEGKWSIVGSLLASKKRYIRV